MGRSASENPPAATHAERLIASAVHSVEEGLLAYVSRTLAAQPRAVLDALLDPAPGDLEDDAQGARSTFARLKTDPGRVGLASVKEEVAKLTLVRELALPEGLWEGISPKVLARYHARAATEAAGDLRRRSPRVRWTLLAAFCWQRRRPVRLAAGERPAMGLNCRF